MHEHQAPQGLYGAGLPGCGADLHDIAIKHRGKFKTLTVQERRLFKRRQAIEPIIWHLKAEKGDRLYAVLCAAAYDIRRMPRMLAKKEYAS